MSCVSVGELTKPKINQRKYFFIVHDEFERVHLNC